MTILQKKKMKKRDTKYKPRKSNNIIKSNERKLMS